MDKVQQELVAGYLAKARSKLRVAHELVRQHEWDDVVSREYDAAFHAAKPCFLLPLFFTSHLPFSITPHLAFSISHLAFSISRLAFSISRLAFSISRLAFSITPHLSFSTFLIENPVHVWGGISCRQRRSP